MTDTWYAIVDGQGVLVSTGTIVASKDDLKEAGLTAIELPGPPPYAEGSSFPDDYVWDEGDRAYVAPPA